MRSTVIRNTLAIATLACIFPTTSHALIVSADYYVKHTFRANNIRNTTSIMRGATSANTECGWPYARNSDNDIGSGAGGLVQSDAAVACANASSNSHAIASWQTTAANQVTGYTLAFGHAQAGPKAGWASAKSAARIDRLFTVLPNGQIIWTPRLLNYSAGSTGARVLDPLNYEVTDASGNVVSGSLFTVIADQFGTPKYPASDISEGGGLTWDPTNSSNILFSSKSGGQFLIDMSNDAVVNPGSLEIFCNGGNISSVTVTGRFLGVSGLPTTSSICDFSIPFASLFPDAQLLPEVNDGSPTLGNEWGIPIDYDFSSFNPQDIAFDLGGGGQAVASIPELDAASAPGALTLLAGALGLVAERRRARPAAKA
jgi:hypothetical protein